MAIGSAFLAEKARTPPRKSLWWCFLLRRAYIKAPSGRELVPQATEGERVTIKSVQTESYACSFHRYRGPPSSRRKAFGRCSSSDSGFEFLPDGAWTATRYVCPGRKRWEKQKNKHWLSRKQLFDNCFFTNICYNIITPVITVLRRSFYAT